MSGKLIVKLAWRNLWRNRRRTLITLASIALGLAFALAFKSLGEGLNRQAIEQATRMAMGHLSIEHPGYRDDPSVARRVASVAAVERAASAIKGIERLRPQILAQGTVSTAAGSVGAGLMGIDLERERNLSPFATHIIEGRFLERSDTRGVLLGTGLASRFKLAVGKKLVFTASNARGELGSELLRVVGVFRMDIDEVDGFVLLVPLRTARRITGLGRDQATLVGVLLASPDEQEQIRNRLAGSLQGQPVRVRTWQQTLPELAGGVAINKSSKAMLADIILLLVAFTILNTILMSVVERGREFAVVLALGTDGRMVRLQVLAEAALLAAMGCAAGLLLGGGGSLWAGAVGLDISAFFPGDVSAGKTDLDLVVYPRLTLDNAIGTSLFVFLLTLAAAIYPVFRSARIRVADTLRAR
jgi:ABC-type lipoprotein release transport system permease subunit